MHGNLSRRNFLGGAIGGFFAYALRARGDRLFAAVPQGQAKRCIVLWMDGGPSQIDTFDPKPGQPTGGEFQAIATSVPGLSIGEALPQLAQRMQHLSVVRNLTSPEGDHMRGNYFLHTGYPYVEAFPRPALGAVVSHEGPAGELPNYVTLGGGGLGPAYMGPEHAPFAISNPDEARDLLRRLGRRTSRLEFLEELGRDFDHSHADPRLDRRRTMLTRLEKLAGSSLRQALDLEREPEAVRSRYGDSDFAKQCLLARRLLETGVRFVELQHGGWDTHGDNFNAVRRLCGEIDQPWSSLLDDLAASGLLAETVVLWLGEFGRTPQINNTNGRDHFPQITPVVLGGGGIAGGRAVGQTNAEGTEIAGESHSVPDLFATLFTVLGIDPNHEFLTSFGSPAKAADNGKVITALF